MRLRQFAAYVRKVFRLHRLAGRISGSRCDPDIPLGHLVKFGLRCRVQNPQLSSTPKRAAPESLAQHAGLRQAHPR